MPRAVVTADDTQRFDLKSLPEGYVVLRPLTYGQFLHRRELGGKMTAKGTSQQDMELDIAMMQQVVTNYEFQHCLVEHNLEDENGNLLHFPQDFNRLEPKIGQEIADLIDSINQFSVPEGNSVAG